MSRNINITGQVCCFTLLAPYIMDVKPLYCSTYQHTLSEANGSNLGAAPSADHINQDCN